MGTSGSGAVRETGRCSRVRGRSGLGGGGSLSPLAAMSRRIVLGPAGDRARDEHAVDGALQLGRTDVLRTQAGKPAPDLFLVPVVQGVAAHDAQRDGLKLGQLLLHLLIHAFIVGAIPVATQDRDRYSLARRDLESPS